MGAGPRAARFRRQRHRQLRCYRHAALCERRFRHAGYDHLLPPTFSLASTENIAALKLELLRDDGAIISLNGTEILRDNMPAGAVSYATCLRCGRFARSEHLFRKTLDVAHLLRTGENVLAVELHQCNATSSDLYFDLALSTVSPAAWPTAIVRL